MAVNLIEDSKKMEKGVYILENPDNPSDPNSWKKIVEEKIDLLDKKTLKFLLRNAIHLLIKKCGFQLKDIEMTEEQYDELFKDVI